MSKLNQKALHMASSRRSEEDLAGASSSASSCSSVEEERVEALKVAVSTILEAVGEDPTRDGVFCLSPPVSCLVLSHRSCVCVCVCVSPVGDVRFLFL